SPVPWGSLNVGGTVGDSLAHVLENTRRMYEALDLAQAYSCTVWQVHGVDTVMASGPVPQRKWLSRADAMITDRVGLTLSMRFADCVPILFYDPEHHALGMAHAGWRGTVDAIVLSVIEAMRNA